MFSTQRPTSSCVYRAQCMAWGKEVHPHGWSRLVTFLGLSPSLSGPTVLPTADPGAWSPACSRPDQKEDDSQVSSTSQRPGNSKAPEALWASVRTLSKYQEEETCIRKACQP
ncbi:unnamed protein product [Rangifer tarandus platyrhynchus]|uniref:Uncharacterized protein n=1 Tax=Rangifer tarandus platyrhynchus TaxID=3082113 RepID=A0ABN8ZFJ2_RANTA|nr:unnamed protein product [Rangifer tarandus platyrhynchus]